MGFEALQRCGRSLLVAGLFLCAVSAPARAAITRFITDHERPYIYAIDRTSNLPANLLFINTHTGHVDRTIQVGVDPTDLTIHYAEGRIYVTSRTSREVRVVDVRTWQELPPLTFSQPLDFPVLLDAGKEPGRIFWQTAYGQAFVASTSTGASTPLWRNYYGDGALDASGSSYYDTDYDTTVPLERMHKYDVSTDSPTLVAESPEYRSHPHEIVISPDGSRIFLGTRVHDADLNQLGRLEEEVYATTFHGEIAFGNRHAYDSRTGKPIYTLPEESRLMTVSGDQTKLFLYPSGGGSLIVIPMTSIADVPSPALRPDPADASVVVTALSRLRWDAAPHLLTYHVFLGTSAEAVAAATTASPEYLGEFWPNQVSLPTLPRGRTYFWRVDPVSSSSTGRGPVWSFNLAPLVLSLSSIVERTVTSAPPFQVGLQVAGEGTRDWSLDVDVPWVRPSLLEGTTPTEVSLTLDPRGLAAGRHETTLHFRSGGASFDFSVTLELTHLNPSRMLADRERPYIYVLHPGSGTAADAYLLFINTETEKVDKLIPIGTNPTDMTMHPGADRLYVTNAGEDEIRVVDLNNQRELSPLLVGTFGQFVRRINAGRQGKLYLQSDGWVNEFDLASGTMRVLFQVYEGDAEVDPKGRFYYDSSTSSSAHITKRDLQILQPTEIAQSPVRPFGTQNLILTEDGARLFWQGRVYDDELHELLDLHGEIYAVTAHGEIAFGADGAYNAETGDRIHVFPLFARVMAVSGDQRKLFRFQSASGTVEVFPIAEIVGSPDADLIPTPEDESVVVLPLEKLEWKSEPSVLTYWAYFGTDAARVASAQPGSPEDLGRVSTPFVVPTVPWVLGRTYYWRVDQYGLFGSRRGPVWSFTIAPVMVGPKAVAKWTVQQAMSERVSLAITTPGGSVDWSLQEDAPWLSASALSGKTPSETTLVMDPAGLALGVHRTVVRIRAAGTMFEVPVEFRVSRMNVILMVADPERPYVYAIHREEGGGEALLLFVQADTAVVERALPIGSNVPDMTVHRAEGKLYVASGTQPAIRVVDLSTQTEVPGLPFPAILRRINAGPSGQIYVEGPLPDYYDPDAGYLQVIDTSTGDKGPFQFIHNGDGETDAAGHYYYRCDGGWFGTALYRLELVGLPPYPGQAIEHPDGPLRIVLSRDGSRLFWQGYVYDADLHELGSLGEEIYATTTGGELAISETAIYRVSSRTRVRDLPIRTTVMAVPAGDGAVIVFDAPASQLRWLSLDVDEDGIPDGQDNCMEDTNPDQSDVDGDTIGDLCDICPTRPNPDQSETLACMGLEAEDGSCLHASIELLEGIVEGDLAIRGFSVPSLNLEVFYTVCGAPDTFRLFLNDVPLLTFGEEDELDCTCTPTVRSFPLDSALVEAVWRPHGPNLLRLAKSGPAATAVGWMRLDISAPGLETTMCIMDVDAQTCDDTDLCLGNAESNAFEITTEIPLPPVVPRVVVPFADGTLPHLIDLGGLIGAPYDFCLSSEGASSCLLFMLRQETAIRINDAVCPERSGWKPPIGLQKAPPGPRRSQSVTPRAIGK